MLRNVLILPGLGNSGPQHWQTRWEALYPEFRRVQQQDWLAPRRADWVAALDAAVAACDTPAILVAHSLACLTVVHWAVGAGRPIRAALLVAPPDPEQHSFPPEIEGFLPLPLSALGFPAMVVASTNDPYADIAFARRGARAWGAQFVNVGECGHINAESGMGDWEDGLRLLRRLVH